MQVINLDLSVKGVIPLLQAKQGDVGRKFQAVITDGGTAYEIPSGTNLSVWYSGTGGEGNYSQIGLKDSGVVESRSAFTISGNTVTVELVAQMLACAGGGIMSLVMNGADGTQIATWNIPYLVEKLPGANSEGATQYYTAYAEAAMREMSAALERALQDAKESGEFDGPRGIQGEKGDKGEDGTVAFEALTEAQKASLKGEKGEPGAKGDKGDTGATGATGPQGIQGPAGADGKDGDNYVLTPADKAEIAEMVEGATVVQAPLFVDDTAKMTDTSRVYVLNSTGHIWAYMDTMVEKEVTVTDALDDTTYYDGCRMGGSATSLTDGFTNDAAGYHVTPLIDLTKAEYQGKTIQIHLEGARYLTEASETWIMHRMYKTDGSTQYARGYSCPTVSDGMALWSAEFSINSETSATITVDMPLIFNNDVQVGYLRFCGKGAVADSRIYITYQDVQAVTGGQWVDTGTTYTPALTDEEKQAMVNEVAELVDAQLLVMVGDGMVTV